MEEKHYVAIDLKSFYASVECVDRGLNPLTANLVVADLSRTEKTICLAVSPALKQYGIPGRARLFEVVQQVKKVNAERQRRAPGYRFTGKSYLDGELKANPSLQLDYIVAKPQMARYMEVSTQIYGIYLKYVAPEDIHAYSVDEVFIDLTKYLKIYRTTAHELAIRMIRDVLHTTGITATAGLGPNLYLCKIAMDIKAKHMPADRDGVRLAELDERSYREEFWDHRPLGDFWRIGRGYTEKLEANGLYTMGDIARCSLTEEDRLYAMFGKNAELLIDHAWGWEPCEISDIKSYHTSSKSVSSGQVLQEPYSNAKARLIVQEMTDSLTLDLVDHGFVTRQMVLNIEYDVENLSSGDGYSGEVARDRYGRSLPKPAHGSINLPRYTSSTKAILKATLELYDRITDKSLSIRKIYVIASQVISADEIPPEDASGAEQMDIFTDYSAVEKQEEENRKSEERERRMQEAILAIHKKHGKNSVLKARDYQEGATAKERNGQIGGHKA